MSNYIIFSTARSGSNHLCSFLEGVDELDFLCEKNRSYEFFNSKFLGMKYGPAFTKYKHLTEDKDKTIIKVIASPQQYRPALLKYTNSKDFKYIFLLRDDFEKKVMSYAYAYAMGSWKYCLESVNLKVRDIEFAKERINEQDNFIKRIKSQIKLKDKIDVDFSEVITREGKERVLDFMGLEVKEEYFQNQVIGKVTGDKDYSEFITNYDEVLSWLRK